LNPEILRSEDSLAEINGVRMRSKGNTLFAFALSSLFAPMTHIIEVVHLLVLGVASLVELLQLSPTTSDLRKNIYVRFQV
jgi:hypothetical protein